MAILNAPQLKQKIQTLIQDNTSGDIEPQEVREVLEDMVDSLGDTTATPITVVGTNIGQISDGQTIPAGTTLQQFAEMICTTVVPADYENPIASLAMSGAQTTVEVGESFSPQLNVTFDQNDAGAVNAVEFKVGGTAIQTGSALSFTHTNQKEPTPTTRMYEAVVSYDQGAQKQDNTGANSGTPIPAGSITTNTRSVSVRYKTWWAKNVPAPTNSTQVRALPNNEWDNVNVVNIPIEAGDTSVNFVIPSNKTLVKVEFIGVTTVDQTAVFQASETIVQVTGADGANPVDHNRYRYEPAASFSGNSTYKITLS